MFTIYIILQFFIKIRNKPNSLSKILINMNDGIDFSPLKSHSTFKNEDDEIKKFLNNQRITHYLVHEKLNKILYLLSKKITKRTKMLNSLKILIINFIIFYKKFSLQPRRLFSCVLNQQYTFLSLCKDVKTDNICNEHKNNFIRGFLSSLYYDLNTLSLSKIREKNDAMNLLNQMKAFNDFLLQICKENQRNRINFFSNYIICEKLKSEKFQLNFNLILNKIIINMMDSKVFIRLSQFFIPFKIWKEMYLTDCFAYFYKKNLTYIF